MELVAWGLTTLVAAFVGSYLSGYLKKKGENLATHEDIDKLVHEVATVTQTTKEIEAKISDEVWNRQKRWEIKKDAVVELLRALSDMTEALVHLDSTYKARDAMKDAMKNDNLTVLYSSEISEALDAWTDASRTFSQTMLLVQLVCGDEVKTAMNTLNLHVRQLYLSHKTSDKGAFIKSMFQTSALQDTLLDAVKNELIATPQSNVSSAAQAPAPPSLNEPHERIK